jgi:hypothetical protein
MPNYPNIRFMRKQADAVISQANPVSTTLYEVLPTTANVRITSIAASITWAVTQPNPLEVVVTIDGISMIFIQANPVSATSYFVALFPQYDASGQTMSTTHTTSGAASTLLVPFLLEGKSVKVEVRITWATTQPTPLVCRVKYAKLV